MYLQSAEIKNFRGIRHLRIDFEQDSTVLIGENTWGKSSLLYALFMILGRGEQQQLCRFSADDLYIPIRLETDPDGSISTVVPVDPATLCAQSDSTPSTTTTTTATASSEVAAEATAAASASTASSTSSAADVSSAAQQDTSNAAAESTTPTDSEIFVQATHAPLAAGATSWQHLATATMADPVLAKFLQQRGLSNKEPLQVINTPEYQRRFYSIPTGRGSYEIHIIDVPVSRPQSLQEAVKRSRRRRLRPSPLLVPATTIMDHPQQYVDALNLFLNQPSQLNSLSALSASALVQPEITATGLAVPATNLSVPLVSQVSRTARRAQAKGATSSKSQGNSAASTPLSNTAKQQAATEAIAPTSATAAPAPASVAATATNHSSSAGSSGSTGSTGNSQERRQHKLNAATDRAALFEALRLGQDAEALYEKEQPSHYNPSREELVQRAQRVLHDKAKLEQEAIASAQDDVDFYQSDVFTEKVESIVIDLIFCESSYGVINNIARFAPLKRACYMGDDDLYRIHYRITGHMQCPQAEDNASIAGSASKELFVTTHELLNAKGEAIADAESVIYELICLNPLLRLRDRRMLKPQLDLAEHIWAEPYSATIKVRKDEPESASEAVASKANGAEGEAPNDSHNGNGQQQIEEQDLKAISHFFADIASDDDLTSRQIRDGIEVLNTIASKYLVNYQSNNLSTVYHQRPDDASDRTVRDIISHPVSLGSLRSLKDALTNSQPSRAKFLMALLAGALMMSKGQREIDEYARPILILEDLDSRFHPTLLLNIWAILQLLPIQKIVTTNSAQLLSVMPMSKIRRLCKQYYDVRCYSMRDRAFSEDDARKIAFHIRMSRPSTLFARCWLLVEGETEVWVLNEIANVLDFNLACSGVAVIEFAQCGLSPLIKLAKQLGISYHVLTDGDDAGRHYAQTVRDYVGSSNLPEHLSVMPHIDIEHYLYTSGFADVYQKAAGVELKRPKFKLLTAMEGHKLTAAEAAYLSSYRQKLDRVIFSTQQQLQDSTVAAEALAEPKTQGEEKTAASNAKAALAVEAGGKAVQPQLQQGKLDTPHHEQLLTPQEAKRQQHLAAIKSAPHKVKVSLYTPINKSDYTLKTHNLDTVTKAMLHYDLGHHRDELIRVIKRGPKQGQSRKTQLLAMEEISRNDVNNFYNYAHQLIMKLPRQSRNFSKMQSKLLGYLKTERSLWLDQVNRNQQRLNRQLRHDQLQAQAEEERRYLEQLKLLQSKLEQEVRDADNSQAASETASALRSLQQEHEHNKQELAQLIVSESEALEALWEEQEQQSQSSGRGNKGKNTRALSKDVLSPDAERPVPWEDSTAAEGAAAEDRAAVADVFARSKGRKSKPHHQQQSRKQARRGASHHAHNASAQSKAKRSQPSRKQMEKEALTAQPVSALAKGKKAAKSLKMRAMEASNEANEAYGALSENELTKQGLSMNKVIDKAIHKKTKPGMAILVSEAMQQRGSETVPVLFQNLFRKVKRLAEKELAID